MIRCIILVASIYHVSMTYIYYKQLNRNCLPYYDCEPGNEIQPCTKNFTRDLCAPCMKGMEQPDLISSSFDGDASATDCFKPEKECVAQDITYSRVKSEKGYCDSLTDCKCNTAKGYYGDPCLCNQKVEGCPPNTTLNQAGACIPCPDGTYKNGSGCGPCRHIQTTSLEPIVSHNIPSITIQKHIIQSTPFIISHISSSTFLPLKVNPQKSKEKDNLLIIFIVILVALVILLSLVTIAICVKRSGFVLAGICWTHAGNVQPENDNLRQNDVELGESLIKHETNNANIEPMTDKGNNIAEYQTRETPHQESTFSTKTEEPRESVDSGWHEENISDIVVSDSYADHKSSTDSVFCKDNADMYTTEQHTQNDKDTLTSSVSSIYKDTKSELESVKKNPKLSIDFSVINDNKISNLNLSATCSPVTLNSEPHTFQHLTSNVQDDQGDTSGNQTQSEQDAVPSTSAQSGEFMSMNVSNLNSRSDTTETIPSNVENYNFKIKGLQRNNSNSISGQSETDMKHAGPKSVDSGVYNT